MSQTDLHLPIKDFQKAIKKGRGYQNRFFYLKIIANKKNKNRAGVAVSRELTKKITKKNYYKRVLRSIIKETPLPFNQGVDLVLTLKKEAEGQEYKNLADEAQKLFSQTTYTPI